MASAARSLRNGSPSVHDLAEDRVLPMLALSLAMFKAVGHEPLVDCLEVLVTGDGFLPELLQLLDICF